MSAGIPDNSRVLRSFPELRLIAEPSERKVLWKAAWRHLRWRYMGMVMLLIVVVMPLSTMAGRGLAKLLGANTLVGRGLISGLAGSLTGVGISLFALHICYRRLQRAVREQIVNRGVPVCIKCGYDLQGQTEARCPECGTSFDPKLLKAENTGATHEK